MMYVTSWIEDQTAEGEQPPAPRAMVAVGKTWKSLPIIVAYLDRNQAYAMVKTLREHPEIAHAMAFEKDADIAQMLFDAGLELGDLG